MRIQVMIAASLWLLCGISVGASATTLSPVSDDWYLFDMDSLVAQSGGVEWIDAQEDESLGYIGDGSPLTFSFALATASFLHIVDAGISGDIFSFSINGENYITSTVEADTGVFLGADFDAAWEDSAFSRLSVFLAPGDYTVTGFLHQSAVDELGDPYLATLGGLKIVEADEPSVLVLLSFGLLMLALRRRSWRNLNKQFTSNFFTSCVKGVLV